MSHNSSNLTEISTKEEVLLIMWTGWLIIILLASLMGDFTILLASIKYKAFKLHKVIVVFVQHIAVSDIVVSVTCILPQAVSRAADRNVFGRNLLSYILAYGPYYGFLSSKLLILALIIMKWLLIKHPLRSRNWSETRAHKLCACIWVVSLLCQGRFFIGGADDIIFDYGIYRYNYANSAPVWRSYLSLTYFALTTYLPNLVIFSITLLLVQYLLKARKVTTRSGGNLRWQGLLTVIITASVYSISYLPYAIYFAVGARVKGIYFYRFAATCGYFNTVANFFIYSFTVTSFNTFLRESARKLASCSGMPLTTC